MVDVALVGLGPMGCLIAEALLRRPGLRVIGAADLAPAMTGRDLGELLAEAPVGVAVVAGIELLPRPAEDAVAVLCTASTLEAIAPQVEALVGLGYHVLTTCEEASQPWLRPELARRLDAAALAAGRSVLGAGINPGFLLDVLPLALSSVCLRVDHVLVRRVVDTDLRRVPLQRKVGVGMTASEFERLAAAGGIGHVGLRQSAELLAGGLGWRLDAYEESLVPVLGVAAAETALGPVPAGGVIGQRQVATGVVAGREVLRFELDMHVGAESMDEVVISGQPPIRSTIAGGVNGDLGTAGVIVNLVPVVATSRHGLLTIRDIMRLAGA